MKNFSKTTLFIFALIFAFACEKKQEENKSAEKADSTAIDGANNDAPANGMELTYAVDTAESAVKWTGKKVTGKHNGQVKIKSGQLTVKDATVTGGTITLDMTSISNEDLTTAEDNAKLIGHLKSEDFFGVDKFPTATFTVKRIDAGKDKDDYVITGDLTIKGKSNEVSIPAKISQSDNQVTAKGTAVIDRTKWDIRYGSKDFFKNLGDKAIYNEVELDFEIRARR